MSRRKGGWKLDERMNEWMNECLTTPQHEKQIGYWVSEKGRMNEQHKIMQCIYIKLYKTIEWLINKLKSNCSRFHLLKLEYIIFIAWQKRSKSLVIDYTVHFITNIC